MSCRLSNLKIGQRARVTAVSTPDAVGQRLMEMGLIPGTEVVLEGAAPLGDPLVYLVRGYRLGLRKDEADRVEVDPV